MFAPTKTWRRWHRKINITQRRYAIASAIAATGVPALVMARGHIIDQIPEVPLVVTDKVCDFVFRFFIEIWDVRIQKWIHRQITKVICRWR